MTEEFEQQLASTADLVRHRVSMGDRADVPRAVDHAALFRRRADARAAADELEALGYRTELYRRWLKTVLEISQVTAVDEESAAAFTREVFGVVERHHGQYDGWGALLEQ